MSSQAKPPRAPSAAATAEEDSMYPNGDELDELNPNRPHNHSVTLRFSDLFRLLFNPLTKPLPAGGIAKARGTKVSAAEHRRNVIERFFSHWRNEVGDDIYPAMRLIIPLQDRDRSVYRLKEQAIAKLLIKLMKISPKSEDGQTLINWKVPGKTAASRLAGDFAGRCFESLNKRSSRLDPGDMRIGEVNQLLDQLAAANGEAEQLPILERFYRRMNAEELKWLIRIILKQMKIGATEKTLLGVWHPDADKLFNVCSSLRHVCWELWSPSISLEPEQGELSLMSPFQPQLASWSVAASFEDMVKRLRLPPDDPYFYIEEKLDGERMQLHMKRDDDAPGGYKFGFWSRKGKNYTHLYGNSFEDDKAALTRYLGDAFHEGVSSCILDGEMIAWDPSLDKTLAFGTLKTAALSVQKNPFDNEGWRPMFRIFDCVFLNGKDLTDWELSVRRGVLEGSYDKKKKIQVDPIVRNVPGRFEIHPAVRTDDPNEIEPMLRKIIENSCEGLVLKNPHSRYVLNERPTAWIKVKPEYMAEYGENLDCVVIGGYYGSGRRGNMLSSFLCGLRARRADIDAGRAGQETFYAFFKVGGGMTAADYAEIRGRTEGMWKPWNAKAAAKYVVLAGTDKERPDVWIRASDSVVLEVKAASAYKTNTFAAGMTLRFPRFRKIRTDKSWDNGALDMDGWELLQTTAEEELKSKKEMAMENRKRRAGKRQKRELAVTGAAEFVAEVDKKTELFKDMTFHVPSDSANPKKKKVELENLIRQHGGSVALNPKSVHDGSAIALADRHTARTLSLEKVEGVNIITPKWLLDSIQNSYRLPYESGHLFIATEDMQKDAKQNTDKFGDSYFRNVEVDELQSIFDNMRKDNGDSDVVDFDTEAFYDQLEANGHDLPHSRGHVFRKCRLYVAPCEGVHELTLTRLRTWIGFGNGTVADDLDDEVTHVIIVSRGNEEAEQNVVANIRKRISRRKKLKIPRLVTEQWLEACWQEETRVSEEDYVPA